MRLAVLIPAYNAGAHLDRTLESLAADVVSFDIVVVDDGSAPAVELPDRVGDHRVVVLRSEENRGIAHALNAGLEWVLRREFEYVARLDAGDTNAPDRLTRQMAFLDAHPEIAVVGSWTSHVDPDLRPLYVTRYPVTPPAISRCFHYRTPFSHPSCTIRASALRTAGAYDPRFALGEDYELFWRVARRYPCANIPDLLVTRLESHGSLTHTRHLAMARVRLALQWKHFAWQRADCWLGLARSVGLLLVPPRMALSIKKAARVVG